ncbi:hypothetical protein [Nocardia neocaledoniensis]|uniref:hypothetical protein n=1 Tax=Nocardia neocaledoniensis TaxID=236511 RepID=UPI002456B7D0|nr:hypothetical protein [Nocardia neocaledoniensis]
MQSTTVERYRAAWEMRDSRPCVTLVQADGVTVHRWPDGIPVEAARAEHPEMAELWTEVREAGHRQHLAESPGARQHADFFHQPI